MIRAEFLSVAEAEFLDAVDYYNGQSEGLGFEFVLEVKETIQRIVLYPQAWTALSKRTRRCRTKRFPYALVYQVRKDFILIAAVMHMRKDPLSWKKRVKSL